MLDFAQARRTMVDCQLRTFDVHDLALLAAMDEVPRERFVPQGSESLAYTDRAIRVAGSKSGTDGRYMLAPMLLGRLIQALELESGTKVLDVACGPGYSSCVMARLGAVVTALDSDDAVVRAAGTQADAAGESRIRFVSGPLEQGHADGAPYDAILINGSIETRPEALLNQLADGGRLVCVQGIGPASKAMRYVRAGDAFGVRTLFDATAPVLAAFRKAPGFTF